MSCCQTASGPRTEVALRILLTAVLLQAAAFPVIAADPEIGNSEAGNSAAGGRMSAEEELSPDFLIVIDATESMQYAADSEWQTARLDLAKALASDVLDLIPVGTRCTVLALQDDVSMVRPLEPLQADDRSRTRQAIAALQPAGHGDLREAFLHIEQLLNAPPRSPSADTDIREARRGHQTQPFLILITDGEDCRPGEAHGAAAQLKRTFPSLRCLLPGVCKAGRTAVQLQSLALAAAGDSPNLSSEQGITAALDSVREVCDATRQAHNRRLLTIETTLRQLMAERDRATKEIERLSDIETRHQETSELLKDTQRSLTTAQETSDRLQTALDSLTARHETLVAASDEARSESESARIELARLQTEAQGKSDEIERLREELTAASSAYEDASTQLVTQRTRQQDLDEQLAHEREQREKAASSASNVTIPVVSDLFMLLGLGGAGWYTLKNHATGLLASMGTGFGKQEAAIVEKQEWLRSQQEAANAERERERVARVDTLKNIMERLDERLDRLTRTVEESIPASMENATADARATADSIKENLASVKASLSAEFAATAGTLQGRLVHLNDVAESKVQSRFETLAASQATLEKLIERVPESLTATAERQREAVQQSIEALARSLSQSSVETRSLIEAQAAVGRDRVPADSEELKAARTQLVEEIRSSTEKLSERLTAQQTAGHSALREWFAGQMDSPLNSRLDSQQTALQADIERLRSNLADSVQKAEERIARQLSEFRNVADPRAERLSVHVAELRHVIEQSTTFSSQAAQQLVEKVTAVQRRLQLIDREIERTRATSARVTTDTQEPTGTELPAERPSAEPQSVATAAAIAEQDHDGQRDHQAAATENGVDGPSRETHDDKAAAQQRRAWERQLKLVPSLGATSAQRLIRIGINDLHELATLADGRLRELTSEFPKLRDWSQSAATIEQLCHIRPIDEADAAALLKAGIQSIEQLAGLDEAEIQQRSEHMPQIRVWVAAARNLEPNTPDVRSTTDAGNVS